MQLQRKHRWLLSALSGALLIISFPFTGSLSLLAFVAWIPLLFVEDNICRNNYRSRKVFYHAYVVFLIYNLGTTYWVYYASEAGAALAFILNTLLMAVVFQLFHLTKKYVGNKEGYIALLIYWIAFEYFHYNWPSSWPWLTLGNTFSISPSWVQWYSYTGVLGGSLWILIINLLIFRVYQNVWIKKETWRIQTPLIYLAGFAFVVPMIVSLSMYYSYTEKENPVHVVAVQPNIDPYNEKFDTGVVGQLNKLFDLAAEKVTSDTKLIVAPETAISEAFNEEEFGMTSSWSVIKHRKGLLQNTPMFIGASTYKLFETKNSYASHKAKYDDIYYESYNTSLFVDRFNNYSFIHKSKLVPGVETIPFVQYFPILEDWAIDLGDGASGTLGVEKEPMIFKSKDFSFAPAICYESIFGEFVSIQVRKGAQLICVATNDGWWKDTPGYKQHKSFASLRAIENRRSVVRSANTGISCFINQRGDILEETGWWVPAVIDAELNLNSELTFYSMYGNVLGRSFSFVAILLFIYTLVRRFKKLFGK